MSDPAQVMTSSASDRRKGTLIATIGVLLVTPDAVLIRWATHLGASMIMVLFWKLLFNFCIGSVIVVVLEHVKGHSLRETARNAYKGGRWMIIATSLQALIGVSFPTSFLLTYAANALLCVSLNPIWSAIFGWCLLKDSLPPRTIGALVAAVVAIAIMFVPRMISGGPASAGDARRHAGNAVALLTGLSLSFFLIVARMAGKRDQNVPIQAASIIGAGIAGVIMGCTAVVSRQPVYDPTISPFFYMAMAFDGLGLASVFIAFSIAPKYVGSAQVGLIWLLETVLGPLWCFVIYGERPPNPTLAGGALLLAAVFCHEFLSMKAEKANAIVKPVEQRILLEDKAADNIKYEALETQKEADTTTETREANADSMFTMNFDSVKAYLPF